jgi:hypothetical protein
MAVAGLLPSATRADHEQANWSDVTTDERDGGGNSFLDRLRGESKTGLAGGPARFARLLAGGTGLARKVLQASQRGEEFSLTPREIAKLESLVRQLGDLKGLPMKFGQVVSYLELDLPEELRGLLSLLQTQAPATPAVAVERVLGEELGPRGAALWSRLDHEPVSIASIGQVYRGRLPEGDEVAVKVRHPAIDEAIRSDLSVAGLATSLAGTVLPGMGATARDFVDELKARLLEECDYALEAERQRLFWQLFAGHPTHRLEQLGGLLRRGRGHELASDLRGQRGPAAAEDPDAHLQRADRYAAVSAACSVEAALHLDPTSKRLVEPQRLLRHSSVANAVNHQPVVLHIEPGEILRVNRALEFGHRSPEPTLEVRLFPGGLVRRLSQSGAHQRLESLESRSGGEIEAVTFMHRLPLLVGVVRTQPPSYQKWATCHSPVPQGRAGATSAIADLHPRFIDDPC